MILIDVYVPAVEQTYDFSIDENCKISSLLGELQEMIASKEHRTIVNVNELALCSIEQRRRLNHSTTLADNNIKTGTKLILV